MNMIFTLSHRPDAFHQIWKCDGHMTCLTSCKTLSTLFSDSQRQWETQERHEMFSNSVISVIVRRTETRSAGTRLTEVTPLLRWWDRDQPGELPPTPGVLLLLPWDRRGAVASPGCRGPPASDRAAPAQAVMGIMGDTTGRDHSGAPSLQSELAAVTRHREQERHQPDHLTESLYQQTGGNHTLVLIINRTIFYYFDQKSNFQYLFLDLSPLNQSQTCQCGRRSLRGGPCPARPASPPLTGDTPATTTSLLMVRQDNRDHLPTTNTTTTTTVWMSLMRRTSPAAATAARRATPATTRWLCPLSSKIISCYWPDSDIRSFSVWHATVFAYLEINSTFLQLVMFVIQSVRADKN